MAGFKVITEGSGLVYTLDRSGKTCTCLQFDANRHSHTKQLSFTPKECGVLINELLTVRQHAA
jgi:hypothetical protein